jgi:hypothetical protein
MAFEGPVRVGLGRGAGTGCEGVWLMWFEFLESCNLKHLTPFRSENEEGSPSHPQLLPRLNP